MHLLFLKITYQYLAFLVNKWSRRMLLPVIGWHPFDRF
jgi:hypothetical protein